MTTLDEVFVPEELLTQTPVDDWFPAIITDKLRVLVEVEELRNIARLAGQDKHRRVDGGVMVPVTWLVGQRIGY